MHGLTDWTHTNAGQRRRASASYWPITVWGRSPGWRAPLWLDTRGRRTWSGRSLSSCPESRVPRRSTPRPTGMSWSWCALSWPSHWSCSPCLSSTGQLLFFKITAKILCLLLLLFTELEWAFIMFPLLNVFCKAHWIVLLKTHAIYTRIPLKHLPKFD